MAARPKVPVDLSLERVQVAVSRLAGLLASKPPVITVAGTNGKGSTVAGLEAIYLQSGYRVGVFSTPYLFSYNEQVRLQGKAVSDAILCEVFQELDALLADILLTPFEFLTLAAFKIFQKASVDVWILEVGLGGRFDAVNVVDADVSVITTIALDHQEWLGNSREEIALEKAGIFRPYRPAVCGDFDPPLSLLNYVNQHQVPLFCQGLHFGFSQQLEQWSWWSGPYRLDDLPFAQLALQNMSSALMAIQLMQEKLPVTVENIREALRQVSLPGRIQIKTQDRVKHIFDVSHNPAAVAHLVDYLKKNIMGSIIAVFSMLADKDILSSILEIKPFITHWHIAPIKHPRGASLSLLTDALQKANVSAYDTHETIADAFKVASTEVNQGECLLVFGSFHTVAECGFNEAEVFYEYSHK